MPLKKSKFYNEADARMQKAYSFLLLKCCNSEEDVKTAIKKIKKAEEKLSKRKRLKELIKK